MIDDAVADAVRPEVLLEGVAGVLDDVAMPACLDDGDPLALGQGRSGRGIDRRVDWEMLIHGKCLVVDYQNQGFGEAKGAASKTRRGPGSIPFSSIRTVTVGSGVAPDLLTPPPWELSRAAGARGLMRFLHLPPVGSSTPP